MSCPYMNNEPANMPGATFRQLAQLAYRESAEMADTANFLRGERLHAKFVGNRDVGMGVCINGSVLH